MPNPVSSTLLVINSIMFLMSRLRPSTTFDPKGSYKITCPCDADQSSLSKRLIYGVLFIKLSTLGLIDPALK